MKLNDRVFVRSDKANGIIVDTKQEDNQMHRVKFFWAKYCKDIENGAWRGIRRPDRKWGWYHEDDLIVSPWISQGTNKVTMSGNRSLENLIRNVAEVPKRRPGLGSDIVITYGTSAMEARGTKLIINEHLMSNKFRQCNVLDRLAVYSQFNIPNDANEEEWIVKPFFSMGGKDIRMHKEGPPIQHKEYVQKFFNKTREFRAHVFMWLDNPVPFIQEKVTKEPDKLTWNKKQGGGTRCLYQEGHPRMKWSYTLSDKLREEITTLAVEACTLIRYDMGGVDLGMDSDGNIKIFEVNSRMGLREQALYSYKRAFNALRTIDIEQYKKERFV
jgi:hypothetical protein